MFKFEILEVTPFLKSTYVMVVRYCAQWYTRSTQKLQNSSC